MNSEQIHILKCKEGDKEAFRYIVAAYGHMVYRIAYRLLCSKEEAEDAAQETFIKAWLNIRKYNGDYKFSTWICRIVSNLCYDKLRSRKRHTSADIGRFNLMDGSPDCSEAIEQKELIELILKFTGELTPKQRLVFTLSELEGLDTYDIIKITGLSAAKIKSNLYLARKHIKSKLDGYE